MDAVKITLSKPIQANGETIAEIEISEPDVGALEAMDREKGEVAKAIALLSAITQIPAPALRKMKASDFRRASEVVAGFLTDTR
jgi:flagellar biosynthesis regulator FlaF